MTFFSTRRVAALTALVATFFFASLAWADVDTPPSAHDSGIHVHGHPQTEVHLLTEYEEVRPGDRFRVGVLFTLEDDWHIYWENPGDAGLPTQINWEADEFEFGPLQWSAPGVYPEAGGELITFGYDGEVLLYSVVDVAEDASGDVELSATIEYLACRNECVGDEHQLSRTISIGEQIVPADGAVRKLFDDYAMQVPQRWDAVGIDARAEKTDDDRATLEIVLCDDASNCPDMDVVYEELEFAFVNTADSQAEVEVRSIDAHPTAPLGWELELDVLSEVPVEPLHLAGVIRLDDGHGAVLPVHIATPLLKAGHDFGDADDPSVAPDVPDEDSAPAPAPTDGDSPSLIYVLLLAFLGGLILNLMPCVFPVLAIKVSSFTELVQQERTSIYANAAAYTGGISASMLALGAVVVALRVGGTQVGWGFQFQQPMFLAVLSMVIVVFALNTFGVFQVSMKPGSLADTAEGSTGLKRSFAEGILAVVLATPCSAPFLGTAVGFALTANAATILLIFFVLGIGLASPFVALTLFPGAARLLPKPGPWMGHFKTVLGFALLAAAIWLVWIVGRLGGVDAMAQLMGFLAVLSLATWIFGLVQYRPRDRTKALSLATALVIVAAGAYLFFPLPDAAPTDKQPVVAAEDGPIHWIPWSKEEVDKQLDENRAIFVNFTADWCLTCKANERNTLQNDRVINAALANDVAMLKADWTDGDETIRAEIESFGKGGVPMYLFYAAGEEEPEVLPEVLTPQMLVNRFEN